MRRTYNRQQRRAGKCLRAPSDARRLGISARRLALAADGDELAQLAARVAEEIELAPEVIAKLSPGLGRH